MTGQIPGQHIETGSKAILDEVTVQTAVIKVPMNQHTSAGRAWLLVIMTGDSMPGELLGSKVMHQRQLVLKTYSVIIVIRQRRCVRHRRDIEI